MGTQIIQQPDGLFALFSTSSDTFVVTDTTEDEVLDYFASLAVRDTIRNVTQVLDYVKSGHPDEAYHQFTLTWDQAVAMDREHGGHIGKGDPAEPAEPGQHRDGPRANVDMAAPPLLIDGHPDYECNPFFEVHNVHWVPELFTILPVGTVRPNPERTATNQLPQFLAEDADGEWIASGATVAELARVIVLHHRTARLAAQHADAAVDALVAASVLDTAGWELCVELADFPTWRDEFGPVGQLLSGTDGTPTIDTLLRDLGVDPDHEGRPDGPLRPSLERAYERAYEQAWHSALVGIARHRVPAA